MKLIQKYKYIFRQNLTPETFCSKYNIEGAYKDKFESFLEHCSSGLIIKDRKNDTLKTFQIHKWKGSKTGTLGAKLGYDLRLAFKIDVTSSNIKIDNSKVELREYIITILEAGTHKQLRTEGSLNV